MMQTNSPLFTVTVVGDRISWPPKRMETASKVSAGVGVGWSLPLISG